MTILEVGKIFCFLFMVSLNAPVVYSFQTPRPQSLFWHHEIPSLTSDRLVLSKNFGLHSSSSPRVDSRVQMGLMEDLLTGADATKRDADNQKYLAELQQRVARINALESFIEDLDDDELEGKTSEFRQRLQSGENINGPLLEEAFAVVREAAWYVDVGDTQIRSLCEWFDVLYL
jgi:hypothetical protein